ncbi:MAG: hypothetical protein EAZ85_14890 [Bacteroidetes bacterium]|nr:MAG: hypothetical protein EAZ85_14890 [Bacteroidota bacterium]TAG94189.1 MAG: hypothetical protein EAZ20_01095 [Bacteroidota bacterium]
MMLKFYISSLFLVSFCVLFLPKNTFAQQNQIPQRQLFDYLKKKSTREKSDSLGVQKEEAHKTFYGLIPAIASNPTSGFIYGLAGNVSRYFGNVDSTRISAMSIVANLTTKNQFFLTSRSNIYTKNDNWILQGDWRFLISNQPTYGLGTGTEKKDKVLMNYNLFRFHQTFLKKTTKNLYVGLGFHYDNWSNIKDELMEKQFEAARNPIFMPIVISPTPYYDYTIKNGFEYNQSSASSISLNIIYDSRDNANNAYKGSYLALNYRQAAKGLGGSSDYGQIFAEARHFIKIHPEKPRILAFWAISQIITSGKTPYMMLPASGWDTYGNSARGFPQGRFRGEQLLYFETEYRQNISRNGLWGFVVYANTTSVSNVSNNIALGKNIDYAAGAGLRLKLNKISRTNICFDYAIGTQSSSGFFINVQEMF